MLLFPRSRFHAMQSRVIILGQIQFEANGFNGLVNLSGFERKLIGDSFVHANGWQRQEEFIDFLDLLQLFGITLIGLHFPPARYALAIAQLLDNPLDGFFRYAQFLRYLCANTIELSGYCQFQITSLDLCDLFRRWHERFRRRNLLTFRPGRSCWFRRFGLCWFATLFAILTWFAVSSRGRTTSKTTLHWLARALFYTASNRGTARSIAAGATAATFAIATRATLIAIATGSAVAGSLRPTSCILWSRGGGQFRPLLRLILFPHFSILTRIDPVAFAQGGWVWLVWV